MLEWLATDLYEISKAVLSTFGIFGILILVTRITGLRSFAKMTAIDFASTIAIGSVLAATILNDEPSLVKGAVAVISILIFQSIFSKLLLKFNSFRSIATNNPVYLMKGNRILHENLAGASLTEGQLMAKLREANVLKISEVHYVVLETTGDVSVIHGESDKEVDEKILKGIRDSL